MADKPPPAAFPPPSAMPPPTTTAAAGAPPTANPFAVRPPSSFQLPPAPSAFKMPPKPGAMPAGPPAPAAPTGTTLPPPPPMPVRRPDDNAVPLVIAKPAPVPVPSTPTTTSSPSPTNVPAPPAPPAPIVAPVVQPTAPTPNPIPPPTVPAPTTTTVPTSAPAAPAAPTTAAVPEAAAVDDDEESFPSIVNWFKDAVSASPLLTKVAESARSGVDSMIVTLDPGMKEYMDASGTIDIAVASDKEVKILGIKEGLAHEFAQVIARGLGAPGAPQSQTLACQPVGFTSGRACAVERIRLLRESRLVDANTPVVAVEGLVVEIVSGQWVEMPCLVLDDRRLDLELVQFGQPTNIPEAAVQHMKSHTASDYPRASAGLAVTVGSAVGEVTGMHPTEWHFHVGGVTRRKIIEQAATSLGKAYKQALIERMIQDNEAKTEEK